MKKACAIVLSLLTYLALGMPPAAANETDQYTLPLDKEFIDMGPYFTARTYHVLNEAVERLNSRITLAMESQSESYRQEQLKDLHEPGTVADVVRGIYGPGFIIMNNMEQTLHSRKIADPLPPRHRVAYRNPKWIYHFAHLPIDPRNLPLLFPSSTVKIYGVYMGTDKFGHFADLGHIYFKGYLARLRNGMSEQAAMDDLVHEFSRGLISEGMAIGLWATGVFANADLAANYAGMKFYHNLTLPTMLKGTLQPPLLVRDGEFWRLNDHVQPGSNFFQLYISDHLNEALNPCIYEWGLRNSIARRIKKQGPQIAAFYAAADPDLQTPEDFNRKAAELATYYGENYGNSGSSEKMLTIGNECFQENKASAVATSGASATANP